MTLTTKIPNSNSNIYSCYNFKSESFNCQILRDHALYLVGLISEKRGFLEQSWCIL